MRGLYSSKTKIRHQIFTEIARLAYEDRDPAQLEELPYKILPGEVASYRESIFLERAVVGERLRVAMGMSLRKISEHAPISQGVEASVIEEKYYEPPLINVIKFACNSCAEKRVLVTEGCQGCLEHPCMEVCPKGAISMVNGKSHIDEEKCIKCGKCADACPYNAIIRQERPCAKACGMGAIGSDEYGRAEIDQEKCVSCGMCLVSCPFSAIVDKGQIYQTIMAIKSKTPVYAIVAPAVAGQFEGLKNTQIRSAFQALGFTDIREVAIGADLCTIEEAKDFMDEVPEKLPFMATSCCPAWSMMAKKMFPKQADCISMALTPMVLTARLIKQKEPNCKIVFVGPCAAKKLEASRKTIRSYVDFVLTFEEVAGMFDARGVDFAELPEGEPLARASADGRGFAASGGVAAAVVKAVKRMDPSREVKIASADGLQNCKKMLQMAKAGKYNGYLLEGMACPGGCIAGAGTIQPIKKSAASLEKMKKEAAFEECMDTVYEDRLKSLEHLDL
ncbi:MAG: 4Fe-4S dicluster domain-containing protein [Blautia sp.]|nr:4Fe-4S dicluster domain-containing protein [Blautia sp.]MDY5031855.1 4Fe-4S dicluster domain-containing protein [Blautia sp.]